MGGLLGCAEPPHVVVSVDDGAYLRDAASGNVTIEALVSNHGDEGAVFRGCTCCGRPIGLHVHWDVERIEGGRWIGSPEPGLYGCAGGYGELRIEPGATLTDTVVRELQPGLYRLRLFYERPGRRWVYHRSHPSEPFTVH
jgi:hypothetical protein